MLPRVRTHRSCRGHPQRAVLPGLLAAVLVARGTARGRLQVLPTPAFLTAFTSHTLWCRPWPQSPIPDAPLTSPEPPSQVYITAAAAGEKEAAGNTAKHDSYALDKISIRVSPKVFGSRIRCARVMPPCLPDNTRGASVMTRRGC